jgi:hypothetical protein
MDYINSATNSLATGAQSLGQSIDSAKASVNEGMSSFSSKDMVNASSEFLAANSMIAKFVFLIFILIIFMIAFSLGSALVAFFMTPSRRPFLVRGKRGGSSPKVISQDPASGNGQVVYRSNNESGGIEYTWSVWLNIRSLQVTTNVNTEYSHIFHKGNSEYISSGTNVGIATINNGPGLYIQKQQSGVTGKNTLRFLQNVVSPGNNNVQLDDKAFDISGIPMNKWFHLAIRLRNKTLDGYINGQIAARIIFKEIPKQNFDDVFIAQNGGFNGEMSDLHYFDYALSVFEINSIVSHGPNLAMSDDDDSNTGDYDFISSRWYNNVWKA